MQILNFKDSRVLITGNTGFKGSWMTLFLTYLGAKVYGVSIQDNRIGAENTSNRIDKNCLVEQFVVDVRNYSELYNCIDEVSPDYIFHLAAKAITLESFEAPLESIETNVLGTANLLEVLRKRNQKCNVIIVTSDKCYENKDWVWGYRENDVLAGSDPYSASKSMAEMVCKTYYLSFFQKNSNVKIATCRAGNVIGGGDWSNFRIVPDCIRSWKKFETLSIRNPGAVRPWNYVLDTIWGYFLTAIHLENGNINGESFNFGPSVEDEITVLELVEGLWENWEQDNFVPFRILPNENKLEKEHMILKLNSDKAYRVLAWKSAVKIKESLAQTTKWYLQFEKDPENIANYSNQLIIDFVKNKQE